MTWHDDVRARVVEVLRFYAAQDSYARQPVMAETLGGWIPEDIPEDQRDDYCGMAMRNAISGEQFGPHFMEPSSPGAINHKIHEPQMWGERPVLEDCGEKAKALLAELEEA